MGHLPMIANGQRHSLFRGLVASGGDVSRASISVFAPQTYIRIGQRQPLGGILC